MMRKKLLKKLIVDSVDLLDFTEIEKRYIGTGNPDAKILIIGKEVGFDIQNDNGKEQYEREILKNILNWKNDIDKKHHEIEDWNGENYSPLYPYKGQLLKIDNFKVGCNTWNKGTNRTWYNYQKITNLVYPQSNNNTINFHENVFITELNSTPSKKTKNAKLESLDFRKNYLKDEFFQSFPVVIIGALGYFDVNENRNELEEIFNVKFICKKNADNKNSQNYWIHYSEDRKRLVINTRQLSIGVSNKLLEEISTIIKESGLI